MKRKEPEPLEKVTLNLYRGDMAKLQGMHPRLGGGKVIRLLVRSHINKTEEKVAELTGPIPAVEVEAP